MKIFAVVWTVLMLAAPVRAQELAVGDNIIGYATPPGYVELVAGISSEVDEVIDLFRQEFENVNARCLTLFASEESYDSLLNGGPAPERVALYTLQQLEDTYTDQEHFAALKQGVVQGLSASGEPAEGRREDDASGQRFVVHEDGADSLSVSLLALVEDEEEDIPVLIVTQIRNLDGKVLGLNHYLTKTAEGDLEKLLSRNRLFMEGLQLTTMQNGDPALAQHGLMLVLRIVVYLAALIVLIRWSRKYVSPCEAGDSTGHDVCQAGFGVGSPDHHVACFWKKSGYMMTRH